MSGNMGINQLFQEHRIFEEKIADKILKHMEALHHLTVDEDPQLTGLLRDLPPPPRLTANKVYLRYRLEIAKSFEFKRCIARILRFIVKPSLDLFKRAPIIMESYWKEQPTLPSERGIILAPGRIGSQDIAVEDEVLGEDENDVNDFLTGNGGYYDDDTEYAFTGPSGEAEEGP